jgi:hypothetical protein
MKPEAVHPRVMDSPSLPHYIRVMVILVARPLLTPVWQKLCRCNPSAFTSRTCSFSNNISRQNCLLLFVKFLAMCIAMRKYGKLKKNTSVIVTEIFESGISVTSAQQATKQLTLWLFRFQAVNQLQQRHTATRIQYCHCFRRFVRAGRPSPAPRPRPSAFPLESLHGRNNPCRLLQTHTHTQRKNLFCIHRQSACSGPCLEIKLWEQCFVETTLEGITAFSSNSLNCWKKMNCTAGFNMTGRRAKLWAQLIYHKNFLASALLGAAVGHQSLLTSFRQNGFCRDVKMKSFYSNKQRSVEELKRSIKQTVPNTGPETF